MASPRLRRPVHANGGAHVPAALGNDAVGIILPASLPYFADRLSEYLVGISRMKQRAREVPQHLGDDRRG
jgi:hypothetical protein